MTDTPRFAHDLDHYLRSSVSNGHPREQAMIRRWWKEEHGGLGRLVWEYHFEGLYADAIWFPDSPESSEADGRSSSSRFPLANARVVLCEAKVRLCPELVGQAIVYTRLAKRAGARVRETAIFAEFGRPPLDEIARELGLTVMVAGGAAPSRG